MATLMSPGVSVTIIDEHFWKWDDSIAAVCADEDTLWKQEIEAIIGGALYDKDELDDIVQVGTDVHKFMDEWRRYAFEPEQKNDGPFGFLLEEKYKELFVTYQPVKPVDFITLDIKWDGNFESDDLNIVDPSVKDDGKMSLVNSLFAMREKAVPAVEADLEYFQNKVMTGLDVSKAMKQKELLEDAVVVYHEHRLSDYAVKFPEEPTVWQSYAEWLAEWSKDMLKK